MAKAHSGARRSLPTFASSGDSSRNPTWFLSLTAALLACPAWAAKWEIVPTLSVAETYTDNVSLTPDAVKQSERVTQVIPGISIAAVGAGLRVKATYAPELTYYARGQTDNEAYHQVYQRLNAAVSAELAKQLLFVDAGASVGQYNVSLQAPLTTSNINTTGNLTTAETIFVSPYVLRDFGSAARAEARFTYSAWNSDATTSLSNSDAKRINLRLASGPAYRLLTWDLAYSRESVSYGIQQDTDTEVFAANARRLITPTVGLLAMAGYENYDYSIIGQALEGSTWSAGLDWTPTPRTRLAATAGERFHEDSYSLDFRHRTRLTTWSAGYGEDVTTTRSQFLVPATTSTAGYLDQLFSARFPDPAARQKAVDEFIAQTGLPQSLNAPLNFFSNQLFLVKRSHASAGVLGVRNVLIANVFRETREVLAGGLVLPGGGDFAASGTIVQTGTSLVWNWRMATQTAWNLRGAYTRNDFPDTGQINRLVYVGMGLTRQFQPRLSGSLNYRRQQNDSNQGALVYTENAVSATLQLRF